MNIGELKQRQSLPLDQKIIKSIHIIEKYYEDNLGDVYISKGGVDSLIVEWLAKQSSYKNIEGVCVGDIEPTENVKYNYDHGNTIIKSDISKKKVFTDWGYALISKEVSMAISRYTRTKSNDIKTFRLTGYRNGIKLNVGVIPIKYREFIYAPYEFSEQCCIKIKKRPLLKWEKTSKKHPITGERADETKSRKEQYLKHGCIQIYKNKSKCCPIGFWTKEDIKECIYKFNIEIPKNYGKVIKENENYKFTGETSTGCEICGFGIMYDQERFDRLKTRKPYIYNEMMNGGKWTRKKLYRFVKFRVGSIPIWSNLYYVPSDQGYGYKFVLNYFYKVMKIEKEII